MSDSENEDENKREAAPAAALPDFPTIPLTPEFLKMLGSKDEKAIYALRPVFATRCMRLSSTNQLLERAVLFSKTGTLYIIDTKDARITHVIECGEKRDTTRPITIEADKEKDADHDTQAIRVLIEGGIGKDKGADEEILIQFHCGRAPVAVNFVHMFREFAAYKGLRIGFDIKLASEPLFEETKKRRGSLALVKNQLSSFRKSSVFASPEETQSVSQIARRKKKEIEKKGETIVVPPPASVPTIEEQKKQEEREARRKKKEAEAEARRKREKEEEEKRLKEEAARKEKQLLDSAPRYDDSDEERERAEKKKKSKSMGASPDQDNNGDDDSDDNAARATKKGTLVEPHEDAEQLAAEGDDIVFDDGAYPVAEAESPLFAVDGNDTNKPRTTAQTTAQHQQQLDNSDAPASATDNVTSEADEVTEIGHVNPVTTEASPDEDSSPESLQGMLLRLKSQSSAQGNNNSTSLKNILLQAMEQSNQLHHQEDDEGGVVDEDAVEEPAEEMYDERYEEEEGAVDSGYHEAQPTDSMDINQIFSMLNIPVRTAEDDFIDQLSPKEAQEVVAGIIRSIEELKEEQTKLLDERENVQKSMKELSTTTLKGEHALALANFVWSICEMKMIRYFSS